VRNSGQDELCFSFWFAAFGAGESTSLRILREDRADKKDSDNNEDDDDDDEDDSRKQTKWMLTAESLNTARPEWTAGQVQIGASSDFRLVLEGKATNGGFAIDQLVFTPGKCKTRPESADPSNQKSKK